MYCKYNLQGFVFMSPVSPVFHIEVTVTIHLSGLLFFALSVRWSFFQSSIYLFGPLDMFYCTSSIPD